MKIIRYLSVCILLICFVTVDAQHSIARQWNEQVLTSIRLDFARPTIHARNLFHTSAAMYDAWAVYHPSADTYFLGKTVQGFSIPFGEVVVPSDSEAAQNEAISYAVYRLILHRFQHANFFASIRYEADLLMEDLGYNIDNTSSEYNCGGAEMGNYIAEQIIRFGHQDGSNEAGLYENQYYTPVNPSLKINEGVDINVSDLDRWQPIEFRTVFTDQAGNPFKKGGTPPFLSPEWGKVSPFSLEDNDAEVFYRDGGEYKVYHDPGPPPLIGDQDPGGTGQFYKWGHTLVNIWSGHHNPLDSVIWDISPNAIGNISEFPETVEEYPNFYNLYEGGDGSPGHSINPSTGQAYTPNLIKRSDYTRVLAEFWADGPESETPPGHWFVILNGVNDHPALEKRFMGEGEVLSDLEWDVKSYFALGGAMHDSAISAWGIKGWYDYIRPISAIRGMAHLGQSSDPSLPSYHEFGIPLIPGYIEIIEEGDEIAGWLGQHIGTPKLKAWRGPERISIDSDYIAGVGWIPASEWWPYQLPFFVTPPFAGYVSGHSTFSRAAAEVLTAFTGDAFFPGGMGEFSVKKYDFLKFEYGPTEDVDLQWATYRDASDQCSLSRIWGGIHPPADDIPGRLIGVKIASKAFELAKAIFERERVNMDFDNGIVFPNPTSCGVSISYQSSSMLPVQVYDSQGHIVLERTLDFEGGSPYLHMEGLVAGVYYIIIKDAKGENVFQSKVIFL